MTKLKLLSAAAILSAAIATPALAQEVIYNPGYCAQFYPNANCQNKGPNNPYTGSYQRRSVYQNNNGYSDNSWNGNWNNGWNNNSGFWPGDVAAALSACGRNRGRHCNRAVPGRPQRQFLCVYGRKRILLRAALSFIRPGVRHLSRSRRPAPCVPVTA